MDRAHTKGPWEVREYGDGDSLVVHAGDDWRVCFMATPGSSPNAMQGIEANAALIAAAPDMFDAIKLALDSAVLFARAGDEAVSKEAMSALRAAIAKAEGLGQRADATPNSPSMEGR